MFRCKIRIPAHKVPKRGTLDKGAGAGSLAGAPAVPADRTQQNDRGFVALAESDDLVSSR